MTTSSSTAGANTDPLVGDAEAWLQGRSWPTAAAPAAPAPLPGLTQGLSPSDCLVASSSDPLEGATALDIVGYDMSYDCESGTWTLTMTAARDWKLQELDLVLVALNTDLNPATGAGGADHVVAAGATTSGGPVTTEVLRTPSDDPNTWTVVGAGTFAKLDARSFDLSWSASSIGSPTTLQWFGAVFNIYDDAPDELPNGGSHTVNVPTVAPQPAVWPASKYVAQQPARVLDTRLGIGTVRPRPNSTARVQLGGSSVPAHATAVVLNVTAVGGQGAGFVTVFPTNTARPTASNLNIERTGHVTSNLVVVPLGEGGRVSLYTMVGTDLVADLFGYFVPADAASDGRYIALSPGRVLDTREGIGAPAAKPAGQSVTRLQVVGRGGVPAQGVTAVAMNLTATETSQAGFVTVYPGGTARPVASNLNVERAGQTIPNMVIVPVGLDGTVNVFTQYASHLVADVTGYFTDASAPASTMGLFHPTRPFRLRDTRTQPPAPGFQGTIDITAAGQGLIPASGVSAALLNLTAVNGAKPGFVTVHPAGTARPNASTLNLERAGQIVPNAAIATVGGGAFSVFTQYGAHIIADTSGYFTA